MAEIKPFKGIRYNQEKVNLSDVVTQPYDKITPSMQEAYYKKSEYNIIRIELNKEKDPYTGANTFFEQWQDEGILIQDKEPSIYPYFQEYITPQGESKLRKGFVAILKLEDFSTGVVLPHERTLSAPKEDRLKLLRATRANFGQIFMLYSDIENKISNLIDAKISATPPLIDISESYEKRVSHKLWRIWDEETISSIQRLMATKTLLIADGHHRYETALNYSKENPTATHRMVTFVSMEDPGLLILPTHRAIYGISTEGFIDKVTKFFAVKEYNSKESVLTALSGKKHVFGLYNGKFWVLKLKNANLMDKFVSKDRTYEYKTLDVTVLHSVIIEHVLMISKEKIARKENIDYLRDIDEGIEGVKAGKYDLFFILNPTRIEEVRKISACREVMPQKSTDFYPKLITGLVINKL